jgi:hypothetical protein
MLDAAAEVGNREHLEVAQHAQRVAHGDREQRLDATSIVRTTPARSTGM